MRRPSSRGRVAWIAASLFARRAVRSITSFRISTIWYFATNGARRWIHCTQLIIFPSSPVACVPRRARRPARSTSTTTPSASNRSNTPSSTRGGKWAGWCHSLPNIARVNALPLSVQGRLGWRYHNSSRGLDTMSLYLRKMIASVVCSAMEFRISKWRNRTSTGVSRRWKRRASNSVSTRISAPICRRTQA